MTPDPSPVTLRGSGDPALDAAVESILALPSGPPGVVLAARGGDVLRWSASGVAQSFDDRGALVDPPSVDLSTRFDLGSVTKIVGTTWSLMALVDAGALGVGDRLDAHLPFLSGRPVGAATVSDLLQHRAGLREWWPTYLEPDPPLEVVARLDLRYPPGQARHYSDLGFMLLGALVAELTGEPLEVAVSRLVLAPLGLRETRARTPVPGGVVAATSCGDSIEEQMVRTGVPYPVDPTLAAGAPSDGWRRHFLVGEVNDGNAFHSFNSFAGHAGLFSTVGDLLEVGDALLSSWVGDGPIARSTVQQFLRPGTDPLQALGFRRWQGIYGNAFGHTGFPGLAMAVVPALGMSVVLAMNRLHTNGSPIATEPSWITALTAATTGSTS